MSEVAVVGKRRLPRQLRLLIVVAVLVTGGTVFAAVKAVGYSSHSTMLGSANDVGFFTPKSTKPVAFSLASLTAAGGAGTTTMPSLLGRPVVLNLWSSTCTVCTSETPAIESVARQLGGKVDFVGVDTLDQKGAGLSFIRKYGVTYRQLFDPTAVVATGYGIPGLPVTVFVTSGGKVVGENIGALTTASLRHDLAMLFDV